MSEPDYNYSSPILSDYEMLDVAVKGGSASPPIQSKETNPRLVFRNTFINQDEEKQEVILSENLSLVENPESESFKEDSFASPQNGSKRLYSPAEKDLKQALNETSCSSAFKPILKKTDSLPDKKARKLCDKGYPSDDSSEVIGFDCPICLTGFKNRTYLEPCFHQFCFLCISSYINTCYPNTVCPLCKQHFTKVYHSYMKVQEETSLQDGISRSIDEKFSDRSFQIEESSVQNFKVATCTELYRTPVIKAVKSLKGLCSDLNKRAQKASRDRQLIYEYSLSPCYSATTFKRLTLELAKVPYTALDSIDLTGLIYQRNISNNKQFYLFLKREVAAILLINQPLYSSSLLDFTIQQILSTFAFKSGKKSEVCTFEERWRNLDNFILPHGKQFLKELTGFVVSPFFTSSNSIQQYDKWIKYEEPRSL